LPQRQQLLFLYLAGADLAAAVVGWSLYDGTTDTEPVVGSEDVPPYASVLEAMRAGWRVIHVPSVLPPDPDHPWQGAHLPYEYVLERWEDVE